MGDSTKFYKATWFMWVMLLVISPVGIFLMWQKRLYTPQTRGVLSAIFGIYFIVMMVVANQDSSKEVTAEPVKEAAVTAPTAQPSEEPTPIPSPKATEKTETKPTEKPAEQAQANEPTPSVLADYIPWAVIKHAGDKSNFDNADRIRSVEIDDVSIFIEILADDNFTMGTIKSDILDKSTAIYKQVFADRTDVPKLFLSWALPLEDVKGTESIDTVITVSLTSATARTIDWEKFKYSNLPQVADSYTEHGVFRTQ
jgi:hypothetical protein